MLYYSNVLLFRPLHIKTGTQIKHNFGPKHFISLYLGLALKTVGQYRGWSVQRVVSLAELHCLSFVT